MQRWLRHISHWITSVPLVIRYGLVLGAGLILLKTLEYQLFSYRFSIELYTGLLALFFLLVGGAIGLGWLHTNKHSSTPDDGDNEELPTAFTSKELSLLKGLR